MIRIYLIAILASICLSCDNSAKRVDPLFYQMTEIDSVKYFQKLHELMIREAFNYQSEELAYRRESICWMPPSRGKGELLTIINLEAGLDSIQNVGLPRSISESFVNIYLKNRNVNYLDLSDSDKKTHYPFYNASTPSDWKKNMEESKRELEEMKETPSADPALIEYFEQRFLSNQRGYRLIKILETDTIYTISPLFRIEIDCPDSPSEYDRILKSSVKGYYLIRNYECMRYFGETYLSLFERRYRLKRKIDRDKLEVLEFLHPIRIIDYKHTLRAIAQPIQIPQ